ncbi:MAG: DMT family transporter, partial [Clostridia bacterium]|nr:DMT family transporter [Clostridia bacterium]
MKSNTKGSLILILCAFVWGMAFSAQSSAMEHIGPMTFVFLRAVITSIVLFAVSPLFRIPKLHSIVASDKKVPAKQYIWLGAALGVILVAAVSLQQIGIVYTTAAKSGFITALYIVMIPVIGLFMKKKVGWLVWVAVGISVIGLMLLCLDRDLSINKGDILTLGCAFVFSFHIILIDRFAGDMNSVLLSAIQFGVSAVIA